MTEIVELEVETQTVLTVTETETVELEIDGATAVVPVTELEVIEMAEQGPRGIQGIQGPAGGSLTIVALTALSGHRAVTAFGGYASQLDSTALGVLGVITQSASAGDVVEVVQSGPIDWPAGNLTPNLPLFLGVDGMLTQEPPITGWLRVMGVALDADRVSIEVTQAYWLGHLNP
jgi:hypothetical protein